MSWHKGTTGKEKALLAATVVLCALGIFLITGAWTGQSGGGCTLAEYICDMGNMAEGNETACAAGWRSFFETIYFLRYCCGALYLFVIYELCRYGSSDLIYGAVFMTVFLVLLMWAHLEWGFREEKICVQACRELGLAESGETGLNIRAWAALAVACLSDLVYSLKEKRKTEDEERSSREDMGKA